MLVDLIDFTQKTTLIMRSGLQFLDFGMKLEPAREPAGEFIRAPSGESILRLVPDEADGEPCNPLTGKRESNPEFDFKLSDSLAVYDRVWLPVPFLRSRSEDRFYEGPSTWARMRVATLAEPDLEGNTHRLTLAFDTNVFEGSDNTDYLAPTLDDIESGEIFRLASRADGMGWFVDLHWVNDWLRSVWRDRAGPALGKNSEALEEELRDFAHQGHYLNLLALAAGRAGVPEIKILGNSRADGGVAAIQGPPIDVDLVLDIGNSRTCGILVERHPQVSDDLKKRYELMLRDLSEPERGYAEPFESRIEFAEAIFGKKHIAAEAGRGDAFTWPSIARVGPEALRLASGRRGSEGSTGLSSPKRYLWDEESFQPGWRFARAYDQSEIEPPATAMPFSNLVNETGEALFMLDPDDRFPVFSPHYSRSSLMVFMLAEVLTQALVQINSPAQRLKMSHSNVPRRLNSITLTVPPSMPLEERTIFHNAMVKAVALVWKALGWQDEDAGISPEEQDATWPKFPEVRSDWDEATCGQVVYLFSETQNNFGGRPEEFFRVMKRGGRLAGSEVDERELTLASIDIGGGTTDLVINSFRLDSRGQGGNVYIRPVQRFRDGFKVAGDDIVLEVIQKLIVPALKRALAAEGLDDPEPTLSTLMGAHSGTVPQTVLRQKLALQVLYPLALAILKAYETYDPIGSPNPPATTIGALLAGDRRPSGEVIEHVAQKVREALGRADSAFDLLSVEIPFQLDALHRLFMTDRMDISKALKALSEVVYLYQPDILLLTGRPSRLPGVRHLLRALLPIAPDRIVPMHNYRCGTWYPFHHQGRIVDPKTTAAVGAMLCAVRQGKIPNFFFRSNELKPYSTLRHLGMMDRNRVIKRDEVYYSDIDLDDPDYQLPDRQFDMRGPMTLGFRQLATERWSASPLYHLDFSDEAVKKIYSDQGGEAPVVSVRLEISNRRELRGRQGGALKLQENTRKLVVRDVESDAEGFRTRGAVTMKLKTIDPFGLSGEGYWLDTGSIVP